MDQYSCYYAWIIRGTFWLRTIFNSGLYSEWQPLKDTRNGHRIPVLHPNDPDQLLLDSKHDISENGKQNGLAVKLTESQLLSK